MSFTAVCDLAFIIFKFTVYKDKLFPIWIHYLNIKEKNMVLTNQNKSASNINNKRVGKDTKIMSVWL